VTAVKPPVASPGTGMPSWVPAPPSARAAFARVAFRSLLCREDAGGPQGARRAGLPLRSAVSAKSLPQPCTLGTARQSLNARGEGARHADDPLDPLHRRRATYAPPDMLSSAMLMASPASAALAAQSGVSEPVARAAVSLEDLVPALVRRFAWSSEGSRGTARLEIGAGELAGSTLVVHADAGRVRVHLDVPPGVDARAWQVRIHKRLASRNIPTDLVEVT
jgi:hypothetical protein